MRLWSRSACLVVALVLPSGVLEAAPTTLPPPLYVHIETERDLAAALAAVALSDLNPLVREEAVYRLADLGLESTLPALEQALADPDPRVREAAIEVVTDIGGDGSAWALAVALNDEVVSLREDAVYALGEIGGDVAIDLLRRALSDEHSFIRESATQILDELEPGSRD